MGEDTLICSLGDFRKYVPIRVNSINNDLSLLSSMCSDLFQDINIVIRWDSVINVMPGEIVSFHATVDSIDYDISFDRIDFTIGMDWRLF